MTAATELHWWQLPIVVVVALTPFWCRLAIDAYAKRRKGR